MLQQKIAPGNYLLFSILCILLLSACDRSGGGITSTSSASLKVINVVAAENFYGNIVQQLGGSHVEVTSVLSDPNVDPHEYTSSIYIALKVNAAELVIENGLGYDDWMDKLLSATSNSHRIVLVGGTIADHPLPDNPHVWYGVNNMPAIAQAITTTLTKLDSADAPTFNRNLTTFKQSLISLQRKINEINQLYRGTPIALTETIYLYQTAPEGLKVLTPFAFMKANAEGNDPPADTVAATNNEINQRQVKVLIYNVQTVTPITTNIQNAAKQQHIPVVPVTETMPPGKTYQTWMMGQFNTLEIALQQGTGK